MRNLNQVELKTVSGGSIGAAESDYWNLSINARQVCDAMGMPDSAPITITTTVSGTIEGNILTIVSGDTNNETTVAASTTCGEARDYETNQSGDTSPGTQTEGGSEKGTGATGG